MATRINIPGSIFGDPNLPTYIEPSDDQNFIANISALRAWIDGESGMRVDGRWYDRGTGQGYLPFTGYNLPPSVDSALSADGDDALDMGAKIDIDDGYTIFAVFQSEAVLSTTAQIFGTDVSGGISATINTSGQVTLFHGGGSIENVTDIDYKGVKSLFRFVCDENGDGGVYVEGVLKSGGFTGASMPTQSGLVACHSPGRSSAQPFRGKLFELIVFAGPMTDGPTLSRIEDYLIAKHSL